MNERQPPLRVAVVGLGFGQVIVKQAVEGADFDCVLVCDLVEERARAAGETCGVPWTTSYEDVLASKAVEAILLYTPPHLHGRHVEQAAEAGKSIRVTKPFERSVAAARAAVAAAERAGIVLVTDSPPARYSSMYGTVRDLLATGELGAVVSASAWTGSFYDNVHPDGTWYDDPELCPGAPLYRLGIYGINFFNAVLGRVREVTATQSWIRSTRPTPDNGSVTLLYERGAIVTIATSLSWGGTAYPDTTVLHGTKGSLVWNARFAGMGATDREIFLRRGMQVQPIEPQPPADGLSEDAYFARLVRTQERPAMPADVLVEGVRVVCAMHRSLVERRTVGLEEMDRMD